MTNRINILYVLNDLRPDNGVSSFAMTYFHTLDKKKYHIDFVIMHKYESPYFKELQECGSKIFILPSLRKPLSHFKACYKILKKMIIKLFMIIY